MRDTYPAFIQATTNAGTMSQCYTSNDEYLINYAVGLFRVSDWIPDGHSFFQENPCSKSVLLTAICFK
jgi:hypothetical protein